MAAPPHSARLAIDVVELNAHAPRPFVFTEAALCLRDSIRSIGLESTHHVNIADPGSICIVLGAVPPLLEPLDQLDPRKTMVFNLEQLGSGSSVINGQYLQWLRRWLVLDYHSHNVQYLRRVNGPDQHVLELPIVPGPPVALPPDPATEKSVDVLFFGSLNERRERLLRRLEHAGLRVEIVAGAYGAELTPAIQRARLVLHIHYYETGLFPIARFLQPVAQGVPVVCETSVHSAQTDWSASGIRFAPYDGLIEACRDLLDSHDARRDCARQTQRFTQQIDFAGPFSRVLEKLAQRLAQQPPQARSEMRDPPHVTPRPLAAEDGGSGLSTEEIEAILEREAVGLPPEAHLQVPPAAMAERQPGEGRFGGWLLWLTITASLMGLIQLLR